VFFILKEIESLLSDFQKNKKQARSAFFEV